MTSATVKALAKGAGSGLNAGRATELGVARRLAFPLTEIHQIVVNRHVHQEGGEFERPLQQKHAIREGLFS